MSPLPSTSASTSAPTSAPAADEAQPQRRSFRRFFLGGRKDLRDPGIFHRMALVPFLAWVGLGADGLSSSAYGPDEAYRQLGAHRYLAVFLMLAMAVTVFVISFAYSKIIEHFP